MIAVIVQAILTQIFKYFGLEEFKYGDLIKKIKFW